MGESAGDRRGRGREEWKGRRREWSTRVRLPPARLSFFPPGAAKLTTSPTNKRPPLAPPSSAFAIIAPSSSHLSTQKLCFLYSSASSGISPWNPVDMM